MTCAEHQRGISVMMDARRESAELPALFAHMAGCAECRRFFFAGRSIAGVLAQAEEFPAGLDRAIRRELSAAERRSVVGWIPRAWRSVLTARVRVPVPALGLGAVLLLALVLGMIGGIPARGPERDSVVYVPTLPEVRVEAVSVHMNNR